MSNTIEPYANVAINTHYSNDADIVSSRFKTVRQAPKTSTHVISSRATNMKKNNKVVDTEQDKLDEVVAALEQEGISLENYREKKEGLGDVVGSVFSKLGITEETVEKWSGIGGCGCQKRKKFLNKIIPFRKKA
tara:strand:- start:376 stop:777 length:402 start_codon:yes stop_codon:yes gene_type:complete